MGVDWHCICVHSAMSYCPGVVGICKVGLNKLGRTSNGEGRSAS